MGNMLSGARRASRVLLGRQPAGHGVTVYPDDIFIDSFPRSGNTWTRFLVGNLVYPDEPVTFLNIEERIPEISLHSDRVLRRLPRPRILKSHECFDPRYPRVIYIVRDPRDVLLSHYHFNIKQRNIPDGYPLDDYLPRFKVSEFAPHLGGWGDHVLSWLALREGRSTFLLLHYEDILADPKRQLSRIGQFLKNFSLPNLDVSPRAVARAVELSSFDRMRNLEKAQGQHWAMTKGSRSDKLMVRAAVAGGWQAALSEKTVVAIELAWGPLMQRLGYELLTLSRPGSRPAKA
jgi:Sulfotransferase domain